MVLENANVQPHFVYPVYEKQLFYLTSHIKTKDRLVLPVIYHLSRPGLLGALQDQLLQKCRFNPYINSVLIYHKGSCRSDIGLAVQYLLQPGKRLLGFK
jgi:hypothetical protein